LPVSDTPSVEPSPWGERLMHRRTIAVLLCVLVVVPAFLPTSRPTASAANGPHVVSFPWVMNHETIGGQGPWLTEFVIQNLSEIPCATQVFVALPTGWTQRAQLALQPRAARTIGANSVGVPQPGAPVRFEALCELTVVAKQTTPRATTPPWSDGASVVTGYTGLGATDLAAVEATDSSAWHLPIVQTNSGWNTFIRIANLSSSDAIDISVALYPAGNQAGEGGADTIVTRQLPVTGHWTIDARQTIGVEGWVGYARITASGPSAAVALRMKPSTLMAITNVAVAADSDAPAGRYESQAPLLFNAYNGWNTGINLANITDRPAEFTLRYFETGVSFLREESITIPARSMAYIYTPGNVPEEGFVGSALIVSDVPIVGAIDEVKYETIEALSYMASAIGQRDAAIPLVFRHDPARGLHDNSGINIASFKQDGPLTVRLTLFSASGQPVGNTPVDIIVPPSGNSFYYLPQQVSVPDGTVASVRLRTNDPAGFVAISNDVNYAALGDGSVVFIASNSAGYYHVPNAATAPPDVP
jgi:hypothetical protein